MIQRDGTRTTAVAHNGQLLHLVKAIRTNNCTAPMFATMDAHRSSFRSFNATRFLLINEKFTITANIHRVSFTFIFTGTFYQRDWKSIVGAFTIKSFSGCKIFVKFSSCFHKILNGFLHCGGAVFDVDTEMFSINGFFVYFFQLRTSEENKNSRIGKWGKKTRTANTNSRTGKWVRKRVCSDAQLQRYRSLNLTVVRVRIAFFVCPAPRQ